MHYKEQKLKNQKIFMFTPSYFSLKGDGVHEKRLAEEIGLGNSILVAAFKIILPPLTDFNYKFIAKNYIKTISLPVVWPTYFFGFFYGLVFSITFAFSRVLGKKPFDIIYVRDNAAAFIFNLLKRYHRVPVLFKLQSFTADELFMSSNSFIGGLINRLMVLVENFNSLKSDIVLVPNELFKTELIRRHKISTSKIFALSVGVDVKKFSVPCIKTKNKLFTIGYFGSLMKLNDVECLLKSFHILKSKANLKLILSTQSNPSEIKKKIKELSLTDRVELRSTPYDLMPELMNQVDVAVIPRRRLSSTDLVLPLKLLEAGAAKKPVIIAGTKIVKDYLVNGVNVLMYEPENSQDLAEKILLLKENESLRKNIGDALFNYVQDFDWAKITEKLVILITRFNDSSKIYQKYKKYIIKKFSY